MHAFTHLLSHTRSTIISYRSTGFTPLDVALRDTKASIRSLEVVDSPDFDLTFRHMECYTRFASFQNQNAIGWAQCAHLLWLREGDQNTAFFHNTVRIRSHYNSIS